MQAISVVIITKNEAPVIGKTLTVLAGITDDLLVADTGSTDNTRAVAEQHGARVEQLPWQGFGKTKQQAALMAKYDWVLALDADEIPDDQLLKSIQQLDLSKSEVVYEMRFRSFIGNREMKHGEWKPFYKPRLFNKQHTNWNDAAVHESIIRKNDTQIEKLDGSIQHFTSTSLLEYANKMNAYAWRMASKYYSQGKSAGWFKLYLYPTIVFWQTWLLKGGFLDGRMGFASARISAQYALLKYHFLQEMRNGNLPAA